MHFWKSNICTDQLAVQEFTWDLVIEVLGMTQRIPKPAQACTRETGVKTQITPKIEQVLDQKVDLSNIDHVPSNAHHSEKESQLYILEGLHSKTIVHFATLMDICHLKNAELEAKHQKYKGRVVLRGDIVKDD